MLEPRHLLVEARPRRLCLTLYEQAAQGWPFLTKLFEEAFKRERVPPEERGLVARAVMDMVRWRRSVGYALNTPEPDAATLLEAALLLKGRIAVDDSAGMLSPEQRTQVAQFPGATLDALESAERLAVAASLPDWLCTQLVAQLGLERAQSVAHALNEDAPLTLRVNTLKSSVVDALAQLPMPAQATARSPVGLTLLEHANIFQTPLHQTGVVEPQDEASQLVCHLVAPPPGGTVVDVCAGAGGKTLGVGALLNNKGKLWALDVHDGRLKDLRLRVRRAGLSNVQALVIPATGPLPQELTGKGDRVLVDAPCSGLGALRRNPEARWRLAPADLARLAQTQLDILERALPCVAPSGRLIYAVCSFAPEECEAVVEAFLAKHPHLEQVKVKEVLGGRMVEGLTSANGMYLRTWPDVMRMDGFFAAVFRTPK